MGQSSAIVYKVIVSPAAEKPAPDVVIRIFMHR